MTNVPPLDWTSKGLAVPTEIEIFDGVTADINEAFGGGLNPDKTTPQGQIATTLAAIIGSKNSDFMYLINMFDPDTAKGIFLDAICKLYFIQRLSGAGTVVSCTVTGAVGTVIPKGTLVQDTSGYTYKSLSNIIIGSNNKGQGQFQNTKIGSIGAAPNTVSIIIEAIQGWETITNAQSGELGRETENDAELNLRRKKSVSILGSSSMDSIRAAVLALNDVIDCYAISNDTNTDLPIGQTGYTVKARSIYVAVSGGTNDEIANAIFKKKPAGCSYTGNTNVTVIYPDYPSPAPTTVVTFERPNPTNVYFSVTIKDTGQLPDNIEQLISDAIVSHFDGSDGSQRVSIGQTIYASNYYPVIVMFNGISINIISLFVGLEANPTTTTTTLGIDQAPIIQTNNITINSQK